MTEILDGEEYGPQEILDGRPQNISSLTGAGIITLLEALAAGSKLDIATGIEGINAWRIIYLGANGTPVELSLGTDGQVLTSTGASTAPAFEDAGGFSPNALTKTDDYTITTSDFDKSIRMNAATEKTFTLPSVGSSEDGKRITLVKQGAGRLNITASDSDTIDSSSTAAGTMLNEQAEEIYASVTLEYLHAITKWIVVSARGIWSLT